MTDTIIIPKSAAVIKCFCKIGNPLKIGNIVLNKNNIESLEKLHFNVIMLISNTIS